MENLIYVNNEAEEAAKLIKAAQDKENQYAKGYLDGTVKAIEAVTKKKEDEEK